MSNLLKEAIVDAKALRESALKNAETVVIEKYSEEVKETLEKLLEQEDDIGLALPGEEPVADEPVDAADPLAAEEPALDAMPVEEPLGAEELPAEEDGLADEDIPLGATNDFADLDGQNLGNLAGDGTTQQLTIDLGALQESVEALKQSIEEDEEVDLSEFLNEEDEEEINEEDAVDAADETIAAAEEELEEEMSAEEDDDLEDKAAEVAAGGVLDGIMATMSEDSRVFFWISL